jgi:hypothetical protein
MDHEKKPALRDETGGFLASSLAQAGDHFAAKAQDSDDRVTYWATRIGRGFSLIAFVFLIWYFGYQLNWW